MKVIVIGAGAAGLMAANVLAKKGVEVIILEAENRIGGRIHTLTPEGFTNHIDSGAEFIHGQLPLTLQLMKKAKLAYVPSGGKMLRLVNGQLRADFGTTKGWESFYQKLETLDQDCTLEAFLNQHFSAKQHENLRRDVRDMAQGLDLADISKLSVLSVREEWLSEEKQYRPLSGYQPLVEFLRNDAVSENYHIYLNQPVESISWKPNEVTVRTPAKKYDADAVIVTASLGCLQNDTIVFSPPIKIMSGFHKIGFGQVIKIALEFDYAFWENDHPDMGFLFTEQGFTFWTQLSQRKPVLIGWLGNDYAPQWHKSSDGELLKVALAKLETVFGRLAAETLRSGAVFRFTTDSTSRGGYSWQTTESAEAIAQLNKGVDDTIWFAGEALYLGSETGTVEAALQSGRQVAKVLLKNRG